MQKLHGMQCVLCGGKTYVEAVDFTEANSAIIVCEKCGQKTLWKLENFTWRMTAPYKWTPQLSTKIPIKPREKKKEEEEEIELVFA